jgi:hypothetical protein
MSAERPPTATEAAETNSQVLEVRARLVSLREQLAQAHLAAQQARAAEEQRRAQLGKLSDGLDFDLSEVKAFKFSPSPLAKCVICCAASLLDPPVRRSGQFADWADAQFCLARQDFKTLLLEYGTAVLQGSPETVAAVQLRIAPEDTKVPETGTAQAPSTAGALPRASSIRDLIRPDGLPVRPLTAADVSASSRPVQQLHRWCSRVLAQLDQPPRLPEEEAEQALEAAVAQAEKDQAKAVDLARLEAKRELELRARAAAAALAPLARDDILSPRALRLAEQSRARKAAAQTVAAERPQPQAVPESSGW